MSTSDTTITDLSEDLLTNIFSRLPVKSIMLNRCISKPWNTLLISTPFVKSHVNFSQLRNPNLLLSTDPDPDAYSPFVDYHRTRPYQTNPNLMLLTFPAQTSTHSQTVVESVNLNFSLPAVIGSCNGLICFSDPLASTMSLLNPSTNEYVELEVPPIFKYHAGDEFEIIMAFGYDLMNNDYKVVRIAMKDEYINSCKYLEVMVYSLATNSWKMVDDSPSRPCSINNNQEAHLNGIVHWWGLRGYQGGTETVTVHLSHHIVTFDLRTENFGEVSKPNYDDPSVRPSIGVWEGCLAMFYEYENGRVDIWTMKQYGMKESWVRVYCIGRKGIPPGICSSKTFLRPLVRLTSGEILLEKENMNLLLWDPETDVVTHLMGKKKKNKKGVARVSIRGAPPTFRAIPYAEALTSIALVMARTRLDGQ